MLFHHTVSSSSRTRVLGVCAAVLLLSTVIAACGGDSDGDSGGDQVMSQWDLIWSDEFDGAANTGVDPSKWIYDLGTGYPGGPDHWGTGEVETMTDDIANVLQDGHGHLLITPLLSASGAWTSGRIETQRSDFQPPAGGAVAFEASIWQPDVSGDAALGYWAAFWSLGAPFRGNYQNWPGIGEIDILEDINGRSSVFGTLHCGTTSPPNPCNEYSGLGSGETPCPGCQTGFHAYRIEWDESVSPEEIRWYLDEDHYFTVKADQVDAMTWKDATDHGYFLILNVAIGGGFPGAFGGGPTDATVPGIPMIVDYVRVYTRTP